MIIRSQDKAMIVNFDTTRELYKTGSEIWLNTDNGISKIGVYSTEEKAIKVLDMICNFYAEHLEELKCDEPPFVRAFFTMPQDSEV